jgi:hypothetical protein
MEDTRRSEEVVFIASLDRGAAGDLQEQTMLITTTIPDSSCF